MSTIHWHMSRHVTSIQLIMLKQSQPSLFSLLNATNIAEKQQILTIL